MSSEELLEFIRSRQLQAPEPSEEEKKKQPLAEYGLGNVECDICHNTGVIPFWKDGILYSRDCECMAKRRSLRELERSGLKNMAERYTLDKYVPDNDLSASLLKYARKYLDDAPAWFFVSGRPGSGKTHICTGICLELINRGAQVAYMLWRDESSKLKGALVTDPEYYQQRVKQLKEAQVLYIDDFFKGTPTDSDKKTAFEILNYRYNDRNLRTIISSELDFAALKKIDEALAGRINERGKGYCRRSPNKNYRVEQ